MLAATVVVAATSSGRAQSLAAPVQSNPAPARFELKASPASQDDGQRPFLGVMLGSGKSDGGVTITEVVPDSPASKAGLQANDVIVAIGDRTVASEEELRDALAQSKVGQKVRVTFLRDGEKRHTSAKLASTSPEPEMKGPGSSGGKLTPVEIQPLERGHRDAPTKPSDENAGQQGYLGVQLADAEGGVSVVQVVDGSPAQKFGLANGDKIVKVDSTDIGSVEDLVKIVRSHKAGDKVSVAYERDGQKKKAKVTLGSNEAMTAKAQSEALAKDRGEENEASKGAGAATGARRAHVAAATSEESVALRRQLEETHAQIEQLRKELQDLRQQYEKQRKTLESIRRSLNNEEPKREPQSIALGGGAPLTTIAPLARMAGFAAPGEPAPVSVLGRGDSGLVLSGLAAPTGGIGATASGGIPGPSALVLDDGSKKAHAQGKIVLSLDGVEKTIELPIEGGPNVQTIELKLDSGGKVEFAKPLVRVEKGDKLIAPRGMVGTIIGSGIGSGGGSGPGPHAKVRAFTNGNNGDERTIVVTTDSKGGGCCQGCGCCCCGQQKVREGHASMGGMGRGMGGGMGGGKFEILRAEPAPSNERPRANRFELRMDPRGRAMHVRTKAVNEGDEENEEDDDAPRPRHGRHNDINVNQDCVLRCDGPCEIKVANGGLQLNCEGSVLSLAGASMLNGIAPTAEFAAGEEEGSEACCVENCVNGDDRVDATGGEECDASCDEACEESCDEGSNESCEECPASESEECDASDSCDEEQCSAEEDEGGDDSGSIEIQMSDEDLSALKALGYVGSDITDDSDEHGDDADEDDADEGDGGSGVNLLDNWM